MSTMARTIEMKGSELPKKLRGDGVRPDMRVRVTIEIIEETAREKLRAGDLIGAAERLGEPRMMKALWSRKIYEICVMNGKDKRPKKSAHLS